MNYSEGSCNLTCILQSSWLKHWASLGHAGSQLGLSTNLREVSQCLKKALKIIMAVRQFGEQRPLKLPMAYDLFRQASPFHIDFHSLKPRLIVKAQVILLLDCKNYARRIVDNSISSSSIDTGWFMARHLAAGGHWTRPDVAQQLGQSRYLQTITILISMDGKNMKIIHKHKTIIKLNVHYFVSDYENIKCAFITQRYLLFI